MKYLFVLLLIVFEFTNLTFAVDYHYESEDEDWIDPGDMISYDPVLKKNKKISSKDSYISASEVSKITF